MINYAWVRFINTNGVFILVIIAIAYLWFIKKEQDEAVRVVLSVLIASVFALVIKELFLIPRPFAVNREAALAGLTQFSSFPSVHSAIAFSAATTVTFQGKRFGLVLVALAGVLAFGRVLANVHYPIDIMAGIMIGILISHLIENTSFKHKIKRKGSGR